MLDRLQTLTLLVSFTLSAVVCDIGVENKPIISNPVVNPNNQAGIHGLSDVMEELPYQSDTVVHPLDNKLSNLLGPSEKGNANPKPIPPKAQQSNLTISINNKTNQIINKASNLPSVNKSNNVTSSTTEKNKYTTSGNIKHNSKKLDLVESGALRRGFYVFLGLSVIVIIYFLFRSYRLRHGGQPSTRVRKYGILARRSDMEMRPLELDEEDDDTLFEINQSPRH